VASQQVKRWSIDGKAPVHIGDGSRGGRTRGDDEACEQDLGRKDKDSPCGMVEEDGGQLHLTFGSSYKTSDGIVETLEAWWTALDEAEQVAMTRLQIKMDNGPESSGRRPQFLQRMVACCDAMGTPLQLLYYPPYHSKYHPIERCWGILALHWHGTKLVDVETMVEWAKTMPWQGMHPIVELSQKVYQKGVALSKRAMPMVEDRLERHPELSNWDILIQPVSTS
jgi:Rhodopirellula transposase DDE domain